MKRTLVCFLIVCLVVGALFGSNKSNTSNKSNNYYNSKNLGCAFDCAVVQDPFFNKGSFQITGDIRFLFLDEFELRLPLGFSYGGNSGMFETGAVLVYYPWEKGLFMGLSLLQMGFSYGSNVLESIVNLNEVLLGWTFDLGYGLFLEPALSIRDPSGTFTNEYSKIKGVFPCYTTFRFRLSFGWFFMEV